MGIVKEATVRAHDAVDQAAEAAAPAEQWLQEQGEALGSAGQSVISSACKYVAAHPLRSIGMALAAGYLISRLTR